MVMRVMEQTKEERRKMYMKLTKKELVEMLMTNQDFLEELRNIKHGPVKKISEAEVVPPYWIPPVSSCKQQ